MFLDYVILKLRGTSCGRRYAEITSPLNCRNKGNGSKRENLSLLMKFEREYLPFLCFENLKQIFLLSKDIIKIYENNKKISKAHMECRYSPAPVFEEKKLYYLASGIQY